MVPYSLAANDTKFGAGGFFTARDYFTFVKDGFDLLYREGRTPAQDDVARTPSRLIGHPSRAAGLERALDYIARHKDVWFTPAHRHRPALGGHPPGAGRLIRTPRAGVPRPGQPGQSQGMIVSPPASSMSISMFAVQRPSSWCAARS